MSCWFVALRAYSLPISFMSWFVAFLYAIFNNGNIFYGMVALLGIILLHLASNLFDDIIDYLVARKKIISGQLSNFNFQEGKCSFLINGDLSLKSCFTVFSILFFSAFFIGLFFLSVYGFSLLYIIVPTAILCLLYPVLGCLGFGEVIIAIIFAPLLYSGTYFVMTGGFSPEVLLFSVSTGLLSVAVLHNHMLLDYKIDEENRKITLCRLCNSPMNAYILLCIIVFLSYLNIALCIIFKQLNLIYLIIFFSLPMAYMLLKVMYIHIKSPERRVKTNILMGDLRGIGKADEAHRDFLLKFFLARNLLSCFTVLLCISIVVDECIL